MSDHRKPIKILVPGVVLTPCKHCGEQLASLGGNRFDSCNEWAGFALSQITDPTSVSMVLPILLIRKLCRLETIIAQQSSILEEAVDPR